MSKVYQVFDDCSKANKEDRDDDDDTPLLTSVEFGSADCARVLLERGARMYAVDKEDQNALHVAAKYNEVETMQVSRVYTSLRPDMASIYRSCIGSA